MKNLIEKLENDQSLEESINKNSWVGHMHNAEMDFLKKIAKGIKKVAGSKGVVKVTDTPYLIYAGTDSSDIDFSYTVHILDVSKGDTHNTVKVLTKIDSAKSGRSEDNKVYPGYKLTPEAVVTNFKGYFG